MEALAVINIILAVLNLGTLITIIFVLRILLKCCDTIKEENAITNKICNNVTTSYDNMLDSYNIVNKSYDIVMKEYNDIIDKFNKIVNQYNKVTDSYSKMLERLNKRKD